jgi:hypothetical protein
LTCGTGVNSMPAFAGHDESECRAAGIIPKRSTNVT